ncbi:hypothetical protein LTR74_006331 [Friedmanniomyces endolithicus]|nr:hypothetical protein LTR74_006331 [Friedmanniomyces endolithicus]
MATCKHHARELTGTEIEDESIVTTCSKGSPTTSLRTTCGADINTPITAVFGNVELLEQILSHAPASTLFVAQRTSRFWRNVMATSILLQRKVFLRAPTLECPEKWGLATMPPESDRTDPCSVLRITEMSNLPANLAPANPGHPGLSQPARYLNPSSAKTRRKCPPYYRYRTSYITAKRSFCS